MCTQTTDVGCPIIFEGKQPNFFCLGKKRRLAKTRRCLSQIYFGRWMKLSSTANIPFIRQINMLKLNVFYLSEKYFYIFPLGQKLVKALGLLHC